MPMRSWLLIVATIFLALFAIVSLLGIVSWQQTPCDDAPLETRIKVDGASRQTLTTPALSEASTGPERLEIPVNSESVVSIAVEYEPGSLECTGDYSIDWEFEFLSNTLSVKLSDLPRGETAEIKVGNRPAKDLVVVSPRSSSGPLQPLHLFLVVQPDSCPDFTSKRYGRLSLPGSDLIGAIVDPADCATDLPAASPIEVFGTVGPLPADTFIWLFVNANGKYYPQCNEPVPGGCPLDGPDWTARTFLGRAGCKENFTLALLAVDGEANEFLKAIMSSWAKSGAYPGLDHDVMDDWGAEELTVAHVETAGVQCP